MTAPSTAERPWPVRTVNTKVAGWINKLGPLWVEGQITQLNRRPGARSVFLVLRDPAADVSLTASCSPEVLDASPTPLTEGARVVVHGKFSFFAGRGSLSLRLDAIRPVGIGELLARIERLRQLLAAEGLFDPRLKRPLPFLPRTVGLVTGRASAAEHDVVTVATERCPSVRFEIRNTAVQGPTAVPQILAELRSLDADPAVDVIVLARGGGSVEDLLPFSDETLCRAIVACTTPVVSAIGHEPDNPLCDLVADVRAATPTDAAKRIVPDVAAESARIAELRSRSAAALRQWVARERSTLAHLRARPVVADPQRIVTARREQVDRLRRDAQRDLTRLVATEKDRLTHVAARLTTLGPAATLARGYAVVQRVGAGDPHVVTSAADMPIGSQVRIRVGDGATRAAVMGRE